MGAGLQRPDGKSQPSLAREPAGAPARRWHLKVPDPLRGFAANIYESRLGDYGGEALRVVGATARSASDVVIPTGASGGRLKPPSEISWRVLKRADGR